MKYAITMLLVGCTFATAYGSCGTARAGPYSVEIVAQAGDVIDGRTIVGFSGEQLSVKINNSGEVAFFADFSSGFFVNLGLLTQNRFIAGAGKVIDGRATFFGSEPYLDMNNQGDVVYQAVWDFETGIFVNETLLVQAGVTVIDGYTVSNLSGSPGINDAGTVLFNANTLEFAGVFTLSEVVIRNGQSFDGFTIRNAGGIPNNAGKVAFGANFKEFEGLAIATFSDGILVKEGDAIDDVTIDRIRHVGFTDAGELYMNILGTDISGEADGYIVTTNQILFGPESTLTDVPDPSLTGNGVVMNNAGQLAFRGTVDAPGFNDGRFDDKRMFFSAAGEVVISEGDMLDGKVVHRVSTTFDMNSHGDVVFGVTFEDLSKAVVVGTPVIPEPSSAALAAMGVLFLLAARGTQSSARECRARNEEVMR